MKRQSADISFFLASLTQARACTPTRGQTTCARSPTLVFTLTLHCPCTRAHARPAAHTSRTRAFAGGLARCPARPRLAARRHTIPRRGADTRPPLVSESDRAGTGPGPDSPPQPPGGHGRLRARFPAARARARSCPPPPPAAVGHEELCGVCAARCPADPRFSPRAPAPPKSRPPRPAHLRASRCRACSH